MGRRDGPIAAVYLHPLRAEFADGPGDGRCNNKAFPEAETEMAQGTRLMLSIVVELTSANRTVSKSQEEEAKA
ncbi:hypothetical protein FJ981_13030 [Mesorhizobium sp. B1-1-4]|uniref:hypothetical protein n=1 Tax=unclassified Mesorhizobium TaxID=325217 RepID=UPI00112CD665|nr:MULTISPECIES: hypothetical protein [unclassified Mesorhizobium]MBZ9919364.1 hypothetical protein [Mesorhizobium sp. BR1-1-7]MBZ9955573.1 hypothetical protein [Mesorhizobium sp. BR1-1-15]MBZ9972315.1 hypothetical protein [Mesorhizobium sp. BR1-1-12]TPN55829.1 hypothetical protein FJ981_13030 [Mesorhizobium sp. B1-1-4]